MAKRINAVAALQCMRYCSKNNLEELAHGYWQSAALRPQTLARQVQWVCRASSIQTPNRFRRVFLFQWVSTMCFGCRQRSTGRAYFVLAAAASAAHVWPAVSVEDGVFALCLKAEWSWMPVLQIMDWEEVPYKWAPHAKLGEECGFFAMQADGPSIPLLVGALTRLKPTLLAALRPSLCQQHPQFGKLAPGSGPDEKEAALIQHMLKEHLPDDPALIDLYLQKSQKVWTSIRAAAEKRRKKKEEDEDLLSEDNEDSDLEEGIPEQIADFVFAAVEGIEPDQLNERDKKQFKGSGAMDRAAKQRASALLEKAKANLAEKNSLDEPIEPGSANVDDVSLEEKATAAAEPAAVEAAVPSATSYSKKTNMKWAAPFIPDSDHECRLTSGKSVPWCLSFL